MYKRIFVKPLRTNIRIFGIFVSALVAINQLKNKHGISKLDYYSNRNRTTDCEP